MQVSSSATQKLAVITVRDRLDPAVVNRSSRQLHKHRVVVLTYTTHITRYCCMVYLTNRETSSYMDYCSVPLPGQCEVESEQTLATVTELPKQSGGGATDTSATSATNILTSNSCYSWCFCCICPFQPIKVLNVYLTPLSSYNSQFMMLCISCVIGERERANLVVQLARFFYIFGYFPILRFYGTLLP